MKIAKLLAAGLMAGVTILSCKKEENVNNQLNAADNNFIPLAAASNTAEIEAAKVAVSTTTDTIVLSFAQQMLSEHSKAQEDLKIMGNVVGFTVKDTIDAAHAAIIMQLDSLAGRTFDSTYIHTQLADHQATIQFCIEELNNGQQLNVKAYANTILQNVQVHYQRADSIATAFY